MEKKEEMFQYTYSAAQQEEIRKIREKYIPREENKLEQLRRLDRAAGKKGTAFSLTAGIAGCLLFGLGMACTTVWASSLFLPGIIIGLAGLAGIISAYPLYSHITKKEREKLAPEIIRLTEELMK